MPVVLPSSQQQVAGAPGMPTATSGAPLSVDALPQPLPLSAVPTLQTIQMGTVAGATSRKASKQQGARAASQRKHGAAEKFKIQKCSIAVALSRGAA